MNNPDSPTIIIPLQHYLDLTCKGIEQRACIDESMATAIRLSDPANKVSHVEPANPDKGLYWLYPIKVWRESSERQTKLKMVSEQQRQARFEADERLRREEELKYQRELDFNNFLTEVINIFPRMGTIPKGVLIEILTDACNGSDPDLKSKLEAKGIKLPVL